MRASSRTSISEESCRARRAPDRTLTYATGAAAFADIDDGSGPSGGACCGFPKAPFGWTAGGGFEHAFTDVLSGRLEYRYTDYGAVEGGLPPACSDEDMKADTPLHTVCYHL